MMNFEQYQAKAKTFAEYQEYFYPFLGLAEEVGEFIGHMAKFARGDDFEERFGSWEEFDKTVLKEAGDVLWQLSQCLDRMGLSLQDAAEMNIAKLEDRKARGVIKGQGDTR